MQHCRMQVVEMDFPRDGQEAEVIGRTMGIPGLHATAGEPRAETLGLMLRPWVSIGDVPERSWLQGVRPNSPTRPRACRRASRAT